MKRKIDIQYLWLGLAAAALFFTGGKYNVFPAAWIGGIFFIRYCRSRKAGSGFFTVATVAWLVSMITWYGIQPMSGVAYAISMLVTALISSLPLLADRLLYRRLPGWLSTLVYPAISTAIEFALVTANPMGSFGAIAYSQFGFTLLLQFASIGGLTGIAFLLNWFPALVNHLWERTWKSSKILLSVAAGLYAAILLFGFIRVTVKDAPETVEVSIIVRGNGDENLRSLMTLENTSIAAEELLEGLIDQTATEAASGAQIVAWPEGAIVIDEKGMSSIRNRLSALSRESGIYLIAPYITSAGDFYENGLDIYSPEGVVAMNHIKFGGNIFEGSVPGNGNLGYVDTEYGRISAVVCWDMDFPEAINQAGRDSIDILFSPSVEWREIVPTHAQMAVFRGVENGLNTVHPAALGLSVGADAQGRILGELNWYESDESVLRISVPVNRTKTLYSRIGEVFGPVSTALSVLLIILGSLVAIQSHRTKRSTTER